MLRAGGSRESNWAVWYIILNWHHRLGFGDKQTRDNIFKDLVDELMK